MALKAIRCVQNLMLAPSALFQIMMGMHLKGKCQKLKSTKEKRYLSLSAMMISICHIHISAVSHLSNSSKHQQQEQSSAHHT